MLKTKFTTLTPQNQIMLQLSYKMDNLFRYAWNLSFDIYVSIPEEYRLASVSDTLMQQSNNQVLQGKRQC